MSADGLADYLDVAKLRRVRNVSESGVEVPRQVFGNLEVIKGTGVALPVSLVHDLIYNIWGVMVF